MRQPEVERELRAFRQCAEQDQDQDRHIERRVADQIARRQHDVEVVAADDAAHQQEADEHAEAARAGHGQRHAGAVAGMGIVVPVADQEERNDARQFPEDRKQDEIA
ncbi:hypothetical protein D9M70_562850 [compost metagenome]